jgi:hypothetical protein
MPDATAWHIHVHWCLQETVLAESAMMVPDTRQRLEAALSDLNAFVVSCMTAASASSMLPMLKVYCWMLQSALFCEYQQLHSYGSQTCVSDELAHACTQCCVLRGATRLERQDFSARASKGTAFLHVV